jgi:hypothetical protein
MSKLIIKIASVLFFLIVSCNLQNKSTKLKYFPVDDLNGVIPQSGIQLDKSVSSDGNGSIKIEASKPATVTLYDIVDIRIHDSQLIYEAKMKSKGLSGQAYLEMWCVFKDKGEFFSRGFDTAIAGTTDWTTVSTIFLLKKNEMPDKIRLNVVVNGVGTVWIDDVHLSKLKLSM